MTPYRSLKKRRNFLEVAAHHKSRVCPAFIFQMGPPSEEPNTPSRVGFTASRKVGGAVERNRAKRRLRALVSAHIHEARLGDYVLIARKAILNRPYTALEKDIKWAIRSLMEEP